jgi:hypothetical protein
MISLGGSLLLAAAPHSPIARAKEIGKSTFVGTAGSAVGSAMALVGYAVLTVVKKKPFAGVLFLKTSFLRHMAVALPAGVAGGLIHRPIQEKLGKPAAYGLAILSGGMVGGALGRVLLKEYSRRQPLIIGAALGALGSSFSFATNEFT